MHAMRQRYTKRSIKIRKSDTVENVLPPEVYNKLPSLINIISITILILLYFC